MTLNNINIKMKKKGLEMATDKIKSMLFSNKHKKNIVEPKFKIEGKDVECVKRFTFLGIFFNTKLNWNEHVSNLTSKTKQNMKIIKMLSNTTYGSDRKTLLKLHDVLISSINSYGAIALNNLTKEQDRKLNSVHYRSIKYAIGAFITSPNKSVEVEAGVVPLKHQRQQQRIKYACKVLTNNLNTLYT
jgi:hypothetical protein